MTVSAGSFCACRAYDWPSSAEQASLVIFLQFFRSKLLKSPPSSDMIHANMLFFGVELDVKDVDK